MKLYEVTNEFWAETYVHVHVLAESSERAKELASAKFKLENERIQLYGKPYPREFWAVECMAAELLCDDLESEWVSDVRG